MSTWEECNKAIDPIIPPPRPTPGGGNLIQGTFTAEKGVQEIDLNYSGSGYPIGIMIAPADGLSAVEATWTARFASFQYSAWKADTSTEPDYQAGGTGNTYATARISRGPSNTLQLTGTALNEVASGATPSAAHNDMVKMPDATTLKIYVVDPDAAAPVYGLVPGNEYEYVIVYSE